VTKEAVNSRPGNSNILIISPIPVQSQHKITSNGELSEALSSTESLTLRQLLESEFVGICSIGLNIVIKKETECKTNF
jgi:hypothetical protein